ncbi:hypothetical protein ACQKNX_24555 [Lysinibacillus sp. NPDC093712]|uniref:hypothetical protein n=1 Tax=Lysinibacillus sp. NPDC093712 TaxID=3390579 RepID=UPI003D0243DF
MINAKVKVSKEVAEAIEFLKSGTCQIGPLCSFLDNEKVSSHPKHRKIFSELTKEEAIDAIFFGYEIEQTPAEKVAEKYRNLSDLYQKFGCDSDLATMRGIEFVSEAYGLKIEGVNV